MINMGNSQAKLQEHLLDSILANREAEVEMVLRNHPDIVNAKLVNGKLKAVTKINIF